MRLRSNLMAAASAPTLQATANPEESFGKTSRAVAAAAGKGLAKPPPERREMARRTATLAAMAGPGPRILLVEDEASIAEPFARLLQREGFEATIAGTAAGALEQARAI